MRLCPCSGTLQSNPRLVQYWQGVVPEHRTFFFLHVRHLRSCKSPEQDKNSGEQDIDIRQWCFACIFSPIGGRRTLPSHRGSWVVGHEGHWEVLETRWSDSRDKKLMEESTESLGLNGLKLRGRGDLSVVILSGWFRTLSAKLLHTMIRSREGSNSIFPMESGQLPAWDDNDGPLEKSSGKDKLWICVAARLRGRWIKPPENTFCEVFRGTLVSPM